MSVEIEARIICDGCGATVKGKVDTTTSQGNGSYWDAKKEIKRQRWVTSLRYGKPKHYCQKCADGANSVIKASATGGVVE